VWRLLEEGDTVGSILRDWTARGIKPMAAKVWWPTTMVGLLKSPRLAGLLEWQGPKYLTTQWPAIIDVDTDERLVRLFGDPARRRDAVRVGASVVQRRRMLHVRPWTALPATRAAPRGFLWFA
jgi:Recombinase